MVFGPTVSGGWNDRIVSVIIISKFLDEIVIIILIFLSRLSTLRLFFFFITYKLFLVFRSFIRVCKFNIWGLRQKLEHWPNFKAE